MDIVRVNIAVVSIAEGIFFLDKAGNGRALAEWTSTLIGRRDANDWGVETPAQTAKMVSKQINFELSLTMIAVLSLKAASDFPKINWFRL